MSKINITIIVVLILLVVSPFLVRYSMVSSGESAPVIQYSQVKPETAPTDIAATEARPRPVPPVCCRPFRAELHSSYFETASQEYLKYGNSAAPVFQIGVEPEEMEIYKLNLEEYRLYTQLYSRQKLISKDEYNTRMKLYLERKELANSLTK